MFNCLNSSNIFPVILSNKIDVMSLSYALEKRGIHLTSNQMEYSILNRSIEYNGVLETAKKLNISIKLSVSISVHFFYSACKKCT